MKKNWLAMSATIVVSAFLLFLWYGLGLYQIDSPLDLIISIIWWVIIAGLAWSLNKAEQKRRFALRTLYVGKESIFNPEMGEMPLEDRDYIEVAADVLTDLDYGFKTVQLPEHDRPFVSAIVHTSDFDKNGKTWEGEVVFLDDMENPIAFSNRYELSDIIKWRAIPVAASVPSSMGYTMPVAMA